MEAYRSLRMLQGATSVGVSFQRYGELLQSFSGEVLILRDRATTPADKYVADAYATALSHYKDSYDLWSEKVDDAQYSWIPKGNIAVTGKVADIVQRQGIPTDPLKSPYVQGWRMIPETWVQRLWQRGESATASADSVILGKKHVS